MDEWKLWNDLDLRDEHERVQLCFFLNKVYDLAVEKGIVSEEKQETPAHGCTPRIPPKNHPAPACRWIRTSMRKTVTWTTITTPFRARSSPRSRSR